MRDSVHFDAVQSESDRNAGRLISRLCGLMFLSSHQFSGDGPERGAIKTERQELATICSQLCDSESVAYVNSCTSTSEIERLVGHWFTFVVAPSDVPVGLRLDVLKKYHLAKQLEFLMAVVVDSNQLLGNRQRAMLLVAATGDRRTVKLLQPMLDDAGIVGRFPHPELVDRGLEVQFRDLVLASCIHLAGVDREEFGFLPSSKGGESRIMPFDPSHTGFSDPLSRDRAMAKWKSVRDGFLDP